MSSLICAENRPEIQHTPPRQANHTGVLINELIYCDEGDFTQ